MEADERKRYVVAEIPCVHPEIEWALFVLDLHPHTAAILQKPEPIRDKRHGNYSPLIGIYVAHAFRNGIHLRSHPRHRLILYAYSIRSFYLGQACLLDFTRPVGRRHLPRTRNTHTKSKIERTAWRLFSQDGYDATSYATIARCCGINKNLVQYHFKKKEYLAVSFMEAILDQARISLGYSEQDLEGNLSAIYRIGCCFFAFLLQSDGRRRFLLDIIRSRDLTESILAFDIDWTLERLAVFCDKETYSDLVRSTTVHMGGFYELLFHCLKNDLGFNPRKELQQVLRALAQVLSYDPKALEKAFGDSTFLDIDISKALSEMNESLQL